MLIDSYRPQDFDSAFSNVVLLLHANGTDGSTTFIDSSSYARTCTAMGSVDISTTNPKFGTGSIDCSSIGTSSRVETPDATELDFGTGDWTIELWAYLTASGNGYAVRKTPFSTLYAYSIEMNSSGGIGATGNDTIGNGVYTLGDHSTLGNISLNTWTFVSLCKNGTGIYLHRDGVLGDSGTVNVTLGTNNGVLCIGAQQNGSNQFNGRIDDVRFTAAARYSSANYTPPSAEFPNI